MDQDQFPILPSYCFIILVFTRQIRDRLLNVLMLNDNLAPVNYLQQLPAAVHKNKQTTFPIPLLSDTVNDDRHLGFNGFVHNAKQFCKMHR